MERSNEVGKTGDGEFMPEEKTETSEIASDRESSIESFRTNKSEISTAETELIDVDDIELSDEESWLYKSPKKMSAEEKSLSTYKWLHKNVEDMDDSELQVAKSALVSKLNQLQMMKSSANSRETPNKISRKSCDKIEEKVSCKSDSTPKLELKIDAKMRAEMSTDCKQSFCVGVTENVPFIPSTKTQKDHKALELLDVLDVQKIARLQEESLKQSTSKFLNQLEKKTQVNRSLSPMFAAQTGKLSKPASVEALNTCNEKPNQSVMCTLRLDQGMKKNFSFGSAASLTCQNQELLRGSLPNINKGYYSLRSKKSKRSSDQKVPCPLPIYPYSKVQVNGSMTEMPSQSLCKPSSSVFDLQGSRTLPSSYRVRSKSNTSSRRDLSSLTPSPRRESSPFFPNQSGSVFDVSRRESAPCNSRKFLSPASSPTRLQKSIGSTSVLISPTKSANNISHNRRFTGTDHSRTTSHSPSRRMPLTTVHNRSPRCENTAASVFNGEIRTLKMPSKIPSPAARSGIPVPSCLSKANSAEDNWSNDCF